MFQHLTEGEWPLSKPIEVWDFWDQVRQQRGVLTKHSVAIVNPSVRSRQALQVLNTIKSFVVIKFQIMSEVTSTVPYKALPSKWVNVHFVPALALEIQFIKVPLFIKSIHGNYLY